MYTEPSTTVREQRSTRATPDAAGAIDQPAPKAPATNERGYIPKVLGQEAGLVGATPAGDSTFTIDRVNRDPQCSRYGWKPQSGHTLLLDIRVATGNDSEVAPMLASLLNPYSFTEIGDDGVTRQSHTGNCTDYKKALATRFGVNQKYVGTIEIVVDRANGSLVLVNPSGGGWEWRY